MNKYSYKCLCCGRDDIELTLDHIIPVTKGGTTTIDNLQPLCKSCNTKKGTSVTDYRLDSNTKTFIQKNLL
jgi:5-methylcytosine-specific restriction endonuclease McrA